MQDREVWGGKSALAALRLFQQNPMELIVLDIMLPNVDGIQEADVVFRPAEGSCRFMGRNRFFPIQGIWPGMNGSCQSPGRISSKSMRGS